jgi:large conductance mechanosensitive channel
MSGFRKFLLRGNVVDLAVAVIIGASFGALVTAFTRDFVTPVLAAIGGKPNFGSLSFTVNGSHFFYGDFINFFIAFLILAAVIYFLVVLPVNALMERFKPTAEEPVPTKDCPECLSSIPAPARKCAFCASPQTQSAA